MSTDDVRTAKLVLADGTVFEGRAFGADGEVSGEVVFNTAMTGYQEIITDPSYRGQIVTMTYPLIGNTGVNEEDMESPAIQAEGLIVRELSRIRSNFRSRRGLSDILAERGAVGIEGIDTRQLTRHIREAGAMCGVLSTEDLDDASLAEKARAIPPMEGLDLVSGVTRAEPSRRFRVAEGEFFDSPFAGQTPETHPHVVAIDCGMKANIVRLLNAGGCEVTAVSATASAEEILALTPDGLFVSNGPGDPAAVGYLIETLRRLVERLPTFGICLGHQLLGLAFGAKTFKLKFGHHGANHPVMRLSGRTVEITSQNHGFAVEADTIDAAGLTITHVNLNDQTIEGFRHKTLPVFAVQYHPEAAPGPHDSHYLFAQFLDEMKTGKTV